jgi:ABC-type transporter Mla MlaB component
VEKIGMLRITVTASAITSYLILEGRLIGPWVAELEAAVAAARKTSSQVQLDLAGLHYADPAGLALLQQIVDEGVRITNQSAFIRDLLTTS